MNTSEMALADLLVPLFLLSLIVLAAIFFYYQT